MIINLRGPKKLRGNEVGDLGPKNFSSVKYVTFHHNPVTYSPNLTGLPVRE
jgi:hypothetical protein